MHNSRLDSSQHVAQTQPYVCRHSVWHDVSSCSYANHNAAKSLQTLQQTTSNLCEVVAQEPGSNAYHAGGQVCTASSSCLFQLMQPTWHAALAACRQLASGWMLRTHSAES